MIEIGPNLAMVLKYFAVTIGIIAFYWMLFR